MMKSNTITRTCLLVALGINAILATPSTQIWIPSTDIQGFGVLHLGWDSYIKSESFDGFYEGTIANGGLTIGVLPFQKVGLEIGIDYRDINAIHQYPVYLNAKLGTPEDAFFKYMPAIAAGIYDFGTKKDMTDYNVAYGLIAKNIWKLGRFSVGGYSGNEKLLTSDGKKDNTGFLASWDRAIPEITDKLWLAVDYMSGKNGYGALSFGAAYSVAPNASFIVGYDIYNDDKMFKPTVTVQVDMNIDVFPKK